MLVAGPGAPAVNRAGRLGGEVDGPVADTTQGHWSHTPYITATQTQKQTVASPTQNSMRRVGVMLPFRAPRILGDHCFVDR